MEDRKLTDTLAVSPQIRPEDMPEIRRRGYRAIVCNRPDGEAADQPSFDAVAAAARAEGLDVHFMPVTSDGIDDAAARRFGALLADMPTPALAYCRSGTRSATLWARSAEATRPAGEVQARLRVAGYGGPRR
ncbi:TIGR01244 family phosphatase [Rhodovulum sp. 12E13]|uniref:TIGR01244 family sulfur transferase n=1 Tax=Rhodovulum sp. 12E13 TaxID=2203891 RepID=UPI000E1B345C|nr:TIGR01244 family sulfur transferase [Rhodovulum sp. 12E13]RDC69700.1 TIGR01244 family phosphatase [Rhodovulum sp. 12E13]